MHLNHIHATTYQDVRYLVANRASTFSYIRLRFETEKKKEHLLTKLWIGTNQIPKAKLGSVASLSCIWLFIGGRENGANFLLEKTWKNLEKKQSAMQSRVRTRAPEKSGGRAYSISKISWWLGQSLKLLIKNKVQAQSRYSLTGELLDLPPSVELRKYLAMIHFHPCS